MEHIEVSHNRSLTHCWWECKMITTVLENYLAVSYKCNQKLIAWPNHAKPRYLHKRNKSTSSKFIHSQIHHPHTQKITSMCTQMCISFIHYSLQLETTQMSIIIWMDKQDTIQWNDIDNNKKLSTVMWIWINLRNMLNKRS